MMSEKRYFKVEYAGEWYLFDSTTISEQLVKEQAEYGYGVFANSLSPLEICERLNEQQYLLNNQNELLDEIFTIFQRYGIDTGYNKRILEIALENLTNGDD